MGMSTNGLSYWQAETSGEPLLEMTIGYLLDRRAEELPGQEAVVYSCPMTASGKVQKFILRENAIKALGLEEVAQVKTA